MNEENLRRSDLVLPKLSFDVVGACFEAYNEIGFGHREKIYYRAIAICLEKRGLKFECQKKVPVFCCGEIIGRYFLDFIIEDQIILELKIGARFKLGDYKQTKSYLVGLNKPLALLVRFGEEGVTYTRILSPKKK
jgi:GxxExxY protein